jgi:cytidylate kinase
MSTSPISERVSEAFIRATGHHDSAQSSEAPSGPGVGQPRPFSVAISREAGTRGPAVAKAVGARLNWKVYDNELLEMVARELHVGIKLLENLDERHVTWLQESIESFAAVPAVREGKYVHQLIETMLSLAAHGRCVIVGRGAPFVLPPATTLRVRLVAPVEDRIANVSHDQNLARHEAAKFIERTDRERMQFVRLHFLRDSTDPRQYDLFLNTAQFSADECADLVIAALQKKSHGQAVPASFNPEMALTTA